MEITLEELARKLGGRVAGDGGVRLRGVAGLDEAGAGDLSFLANAKYMALLSTTKASAVVVKEGVACPLPALVVANPDLAFGRAAELFVGTPPPPPPGVHPTALVAPGARLGAGAAVGPLCIVEEGAVIGERTVLAAQVYVGRDAKIGPDCLLHPQTVVRERCELGARVILQPGAVIGGDGFGYATDRGVHHKIPQVGIVVLEDDVEIGSNSTIDRARFGRTVVGRGTKIDNLVMIAHNVSTGRGCLLVSQCGVAGSTRLGDYVVLAGQAGVIGHLELGDGAVITAQTGLTKDVPPGAVMSGSPASDRKTHLKELAALARIPEALPELRRLREELDALKKKIQG
jgi:UDP-3-O-[3-hydroxymyristoyl] glucosamine N-acyltransferase